MADAAIQRPTTAVERTSSATAARGDGQPLDAATRVDMEARFGRDFSAVRVHTSGRAADSADALGARAYALGPCLVFGSGEYQPATSVGRHLIAHELAHVVQTGGDAGAPLLMYRRPQCHDGRLSREQFVNGIGWLEQQAVITTEEAESLRSAVPESRRARCNLIAALEERARRGRAGRVRGRDPHERTRHLITNFAVTPRVFRVDQGEAARISFDAVGSVDRVEALIIKYEFSSERPDLRDFRFAPGPGHKVAVWDGTFTGSRNRAPESGTYRVRIFATDLDGNSEQAVEQIRVENASGSTVLPRTESGLGLRSLSFDGRRAVLTDDGGNQISARAISGLRPNNPRNPDRRDYTDPRYQAVADRGPIPPGRYFIDGNAAQTPELARGRLRYPSGAGASGWGPFRAPLRPADPSRVHGRSEFFFHLDTRNDGTAGCIGIQTADQAKFNQMMALILRIPTGESLPVEVAY